MMEKKTVVNLFGAPGAGKSTAAHYITARLKMHGLHAEFTGEYAKDCAWENRASTVTDQIYVFAKQWHRLYTLSKCAYLDVIVTDSPLLLSLHYNPDEWVQDPLAGLVLACFERFDNKCYWMEREDFEFEACGRFHITPEEAAAESMGIAHMLSALGIEVQRISSCTEDFDSVVNDIISNTVVGLAENEIPLKL